MRDAGSLRRTICIYRGDTLLQMTKSRFAIRLQRMVRGVLARNNNPAATFVSLAYRAARTLVRRVQDGETDEGTPLCADGDPFWIVNFLACGDEEDLESRYDDMLFVPAARSATAADWPDLDLFFAGKVKCLQICADWSNQNAPRDDMCVSLVDIMTLLDKHPGLCTRLRRYTDPSTYPLTVGRHVDMHTPSDGILFG